MERAALPVPSQYQSGIIQAFRQNRGVVIEAVAGAGKTTTMLMLVQSNPDKDFLLLTYNASLRLECKQRCKKLRLNNVQVHTYHSFCRRYFVSSGYTDRILRRTVRDNLAPKQSYCFDAVLLDEIQDCTPLYHAFLKHVFANNSCDSKDLKIVVVGDPRQNMYGYQGSDSRFLTLAPDMNIFGSILGPFASWTTCPLHESQRLPRSHASFVDAAMLRNQGDITSSKEDGEKPKIIVCNVFGDAPFQQVMKWLTQDHVSWQDIMILSPSLRQSTPAQCLQLRLSAAGIPCYVPVGDEVEPSEKAMKNKITFSTFHQSKGRERKCVLVFGFDANYFKLYAREDPIGVCPNPLYVAATRSKHAITFLQDSRVEPLPFLNVPVAKHLADWVQETPTAENAPDNNVLDKPQTFSVTKLLRHLPEAFIEDVLDAFTFEALSPASSRSIEVPNEHPSKLPGPSNRLLGGSVEEVSDINGHVATALVDMKIRDHMSEHCSIVQYSSNKRCTSRFGFEISQHMQTVWDNYIKHEELSLEDVVFVCSIYADDNNQYTARTQQLCSFAWWTEQAASEVIDVFEEIGVIPSPGSECPPPMFEVSYGTTLGIDQGSYTIEGRADIVTEDTLFEVKFVKDLRCEHRLQLVLYAWLYGRVHGDEAAEQMRFVLLNAKTRESWLLKYDKVALDAAVQKVLAQRLASSVTNKTDTEFLSFVSTLVV
jgi:hypothetical protein